MTHNERSTFQTLAILAFGLGLMVFGLRSETKVRASEQTVTQQKLLNNATATATTRAKIGGPMANCRETAIYVDWATGVTAGAVTVESAVDSNYAGTWAPLQVVTFSGTAPKQDIVQITGVHWSIGTRVSTVITTGSGNGVTTWAVCN